MKTLSNVTKIASIIGDIINEIINDLGDIQGREEEFTSMFRSEINMHLLDKAKQKLHGKKFGNFKVHITTFKKKEEKNIGADFACIFEMNNSGNKISKVFLSQAKVGKTATKEIFQFKRNNIVSQCENMLNITSDSFIFIYTNDGTFVIPAYQIILQKHKNTIKSSEFYYKNITKFYQDFFKCFIGDHQIIPKDIKTFGEELNLNILKISLNNQL